MANKNSYLNFYKIILEKVSFNAELFRKEYKKALNQLSDHEQIELNEWVNRNFKSIMDVTGQNDNYNFNNELNYYFQGDGINKEAR